MRLGDFTLARGDATAALSLYRRAHKRRPAGTGAADPPGQRAGPRRLVRGVGRRLPRRARPRTRQRRGGARAGQRGDRVEPAAECDELSGGGGRPPGRRRAAVQHLRRGSGPPRSPRRSADPVPQGSRRHAERSGPEDQPGHFAGAFRPVRRGGDGDARRRHGARRQAPSTARTWPWFSGSPAAGRKPRRSRGSMPTRRPWRRT